MKNLFLIFLVIFLAQISNAQEYINISDKSYRVDTLVHKHQVGPGTHYYHIDLPEFPLKIHVLEVNLKHPNVMLETCLGGDSAVITERPTSMVQRKSTTGHNVFAATNGDFYFYIDPVEIGIPRSGQFAQYECVTNPVGRAAFVLDNARKPYIDRVDFRGFVSSKDKTVRLHTVNMQRLELESEASKDMLTLYTNAYGKYTSGITEGWKVIISPKANETFFFSANKEIACVVELVAENTGVSPIPDGKAVLHGRGISADFLRSLKTGDELVVNLKTNLRNNPGLLSDFKELMGGSNHILLKNGERYEGDESSNPRTGMGFSKDSTIVYMVEVDGRQTASRGVTLFEFGDIFKGIGAWNAVNLDGGGSSVMIVNNEVKNIPSDGGVRPVGNGMLVVSNSPEDKEVASIVFAPVSYNLPICGFLKPAVYAYNKYGDLLSKDLLGVSVSCDSEVGYITSEGNFVGVEKEASGILTAEYKGLKTYKSISLAGSDLDLKLDSVVINHLTDYHIELQAKVNDKPMQVAPEAFQWLVDDPSVCSVTAGVLKGLANGVTYVHGNLGEFRCVLKVIVEIPAASVKALPALNEPLWTVKSTSNLKNIRLNSDGIEYDYTSGRSPYIELIGDVRLYSLPTSIRMLLNVGKAGLSKLTFSIRSNTDPSYSAYEYSDIPKNEDKEIIIPVTDILNDPAELAGYPIHLRSIRFAFTSDNLAESNKIEIKKLETVYTYITVGFEDIETCSRVVIYPNPVKDEALLNLNANTNEVQKIIVGIYALNGLKVAQRDYGMSHGQNLVLPIENLNNGTYLVQVFAGNESFTVKLIIHK